jgi:hypothetical protein
VNAGADQLALFGDALAPPQVAGLPSGWDYRSDFIDADEEAALLAFIATLPLEEARYKGYTARRRVAHFGSAYDYDDHSCCPGRRCRRARAAARAGGGVGRRAPEAFANALVAEYRPAFRSAGTATFPTSRPSSRLARGHGADAVSPLPPVAPKKADVVCARARAALGVRAARRARWGWQHSIAPTPALRLLDHLSHAFGEGWTAHLTHARRASR